jgi:F0F1-type ATP synthase assembly protein I
MKKTKFKAVERTKLFYALFLGAQLGFLIALPLVGFLLGGIFLDRKFNRSPLFLSLAIFFSFAFIGFEVHRLVFPFLEKVKQNPDSLNSQKTIIDKNAS